MLLIDADYQSSLTSTFEMLQAPTTLFDALVGNDAQIYPIDDNLSLLPASIRLNEIDVLLQPKMYREFQMMKWAKAHAEELNQFDYILIDTHPEFSTLVKNMIMISDYVFIPLEPSQYGFTESITQFTQYMNAFVEDSINPSTGISDVDAKVMYLANKIDSRKNTSKAFTAAISRMDNVIAKFKARELFNLSTINQVPVSALPQSELNAAKGFESEFQTQFQSMLEATVK